jgi:hypothetical protein
MKSMYFKDGLKALDIEEIRTSWKDVLIISIGSMGRTSS